MSLHGLPPRQGLYDPRYEHDACGMGFVVNIKGAASHKIVKQALRILVNLDHRGARGAEVATGDGAGILLQIPHEFFKAQCPQLELPAPGQYGVGIVFMPREEGLHSRAGRLLEEIIADEGQTVLGWRDVPVNNEPLGKTAKACEPVIRQVFIGRSEALGDDDQAFERALYIIRKRMEAAAKSHDKVLEAAGFYIPSLSSRTLVYKGMLTPEQVEEYYLDLQDEQMQTGLAMVHSRFSTNTFPSWARAHPNRYVIHNGEINTLRGNLNWMNARQALLETDLYGEDITRIMPILDDEGSDSGVFDNCLEFLTLSGRSLAHSVMMMIPEPWSKHESMSDEKKAFYEYHSCLMEPWDGPASIGFTDGVRVGAVLDRNGLRPSRYYVTNDDLVVLASEVGVLDDIPPETVIEKGRLQPGRMFLVDTEKGRIVEDAEIKREMVEAQPYRQWIDENLVKLSDLPAGEEPQLPDHDTILHRQQAFGYTVEDIGIIMAPMARDGVEPLGSMGIDTPLAALSERPQLLYNYFKQLFAQVTNPPIDAIREEIITGTDTTLGPEGNLLDPQPSSCRQINLKSPLLSNNQLEQLRALNGKNSPFQSVTLPILYPVNEGAAGLERALDELFQKASDAIEAGADVVILSDRGLDYENAAIPALLAVAGLHHHLIRKGTRTKAGLVLESGEPREVHHFALLIGYGASAINPYLAYETLDDQLRQGRLPDVTHEEAIAHFIKAGTKGVVKTMSKMGISTIQSYRGAQIFECVGIGDEVIDRYFTWTPSRIGGIGMEEIARQVKQRHRLGFPERAVAFSNLPISGRYQWRAEGEHHLYNPQTIQKLQFACRTGNFEVYQEFTQLINDRARKLSTLRGLLDFKTDGATPVPLEEVESVDSIVQRFKTGAMSYGSISKEAHEALAVAMNRLGGKSNTGEGGEDPDRYQLDPDGDSRNSAIKQVASGRFGVTSKYLVEAQEIQIKMAQGAKPGEGGQLPGTKVYPWIAKVRNSTPGVGLISPPPHHDIYSIEDLAELIHDLKNANERARINVKLVAEVGVGTIAAGVAKAHADVILISGHDGGTGASPHSSIQHAGLPWEMGLAETHQTLMLNNLRSRVVVETDGKLLSGRDVVIAAMLGAEEFGFATAPLVVLGCIMMRVCHLDTCPVGVATQNPTLRYNFKGDPAHVVNFMRFVAEDMRQIMAELGFRTIEEMVGRVDRLEAARAIEHWQAQGIDLSKVLHQPEVGEDQPRLCCRAQDHGLQHSLDKRVLLEQCKPAIERGEKVRFETAIQNTDRVVGTITGSELTRTHGPDGLPADTIHLKFNGSAGQSFGAFVPRGMTLELEGDANDYVGKGLSGGKIIVYPPKVSIFKAEENILIGNVAFYGATDGEAYIRGVAGERFCVRNSGVNTVVEGVGDHGCEYMTGGRVVILGKTGRNFAAGMSGGIAYVWDEAGDFAGHCNTQMVGLDELSDWEEINAVKAMIERHHEYTGSDMAARVLGDWDNALQQFVKVMPHDFKRVLEAMQRVEGSGLSGEAAVMAAFEENKRDLSRIGGN